MIKSFPKIFAIGDRHISGIFDNEVEITEKVDGSQWVMGKIKGELYMRSKGQIVYSGTSNKMFEIAVDYTESIEHKIPDNTIFYCEYFQKPKHNTLAYGRVPKNNLILFGVSDSEDRFISKYEELKKYAEMIDIEIVPLIFSGKINNAEEIFKLIEQESILGGVNMEGIVVKNYTEFFVGNQVVFLMAGKYVSEKFKEKHTKDWKKGTTKGKFEIFKDSFRTEARWLKGIQHLKEKGELENSPRDIGKLIKEIHLDIEEEEKENIKDFLYKEFMKDILRNATRGFPEFYKKEILKGEFK